MTPFERPLPPEAVAVFPNLDGPSGVGRENGGCRIEGNGHGKAGRDPTAGCNVVMRDSRLPPSRSARAGTRDQVLVPADELPPER